jgi:hypothetical protein
MDIRFAPTTCTWKARVRFPGRRGMADQVDFQIFPRGFNEVVTLTRTLKRPPPGCGRPVWPDTWHRPPF